MLDSGHGIAQCKKGTGGVLGSEIAGDAQNMSLVYCGQINKVFGTLAPMIIGLGEIPV